jgi:AcrR family transcriptional regulator
MDSKSTKKELQKEATKQALLDALEQELAVASRLTVERIAARAGVNKTLVYRYFDGLNGLLTAFGSSATFMPQAAELLETCPADVTVRPPIERFAFCVKAYVTALSKRPAMVQILLRFPHLDPVVKTALMAGRAQHIEAVRAAFHTDGADLPFDLDTAFSLLISGTCVLLTNNGLPQTAAANDYSTIVNRLHGAIDGMLLSMVKQDACIKPPQQGPAPKVQPTRVRKT